MNPSSVTPFSPNHSEQKPADGCWRSGSARLSSNRDVAVVQADYLALANDLEQAQSLASTLEMQLSGKTNELANFKLVWERTQSDLVKLAQDLDTMRKERHSLANEAQRGYAFELKCEKLKAAHDEVSSRAERLETELIRERAAHVQSRAELEEIRTRQERVGGLHGARDPEFRRSLEGLREQLDRVLGPSPSAANAPRERGIKTAALDRIDIEFAG